MAQLAEKKLRTISEDFLYPSSAMRGNVNDKTQPSKDKARQCSVMKVRASLPIPPDDLYAALNQFAEEYKSVPSVTFVFDLRNETVTNLSSPCTNGIQSF